MLRTRSPLSGQPKPAFVARLAFVKYAASVCPEPGSNSPVNHTRRVSPRTGFDGSRSHSHERARPCLAPPSPRFTFTHAIQFPRIDPAPGVSTPDRQKQSLPARLGRVKGILQNLPRILLGRRHGAPGPCSEPVEGPDRPHGRRLVPERDFAPRSGFWNGRVGGPLPPGPWAAGALACRHWPIGGRRAAWPGAAESPPSPPILSPAGPAAGRSLATRRSRGPARTGCRWR